MEEFNKLIQEIGKSLDIKVTLLSDNWLTVLEKDNNIHYIQGYKFDLNNHGLGNIVDDKGLFYDLLTYKNLPIIEHKVLFKNYDKDFVLDYFNIHNKEIIVKGNIGTCGKQVYKVNDTSTLFDTIDKLLESQFSISLCPYYDIINEYRVIVLNNEARVVYGKKRPIVIGDGKSTLKELAYSFNPNFYGKEKNLENIKDYIPKENESVILNFQFNLSRGALMFLDIEENLKNELVSLALKVSKEVNLTFGSIDIIKTSDNKLLIMEANSGVMMDNFIKLNKDGYSITKNIYRDAILLMFSK